MNTNDFGDWLSRQLKRREWTQADFVRQTGFSSSAVSSWIKGQRIPDPPSCDRIADALHIDVETVLRKAGHLPDPGTVDELQAEIISLVQRIRWSPERVAMVRALLESMVKTDG